MPNDTDGANQILVNEIAEKVLAATRHAKQARRRTLDHIKESPLNIKAANVKLKRAYVPAHADDGTRVLVDRLWPRGVRKAAAAIDLWLKEIAPSTELRKWFDHDPAHWAEFRQRYSRAVRAHPELLGRLRALARKGTLTLVYSAHDEQNNNAVVLRTVILGRRL